MRSPWAGALKSKRPAVVLLGALLVFAFTSVTSAVVFRHIPHVNDEIGYLFQAKIFALGKLSVPTPCGGDAFSFTHIINNGRWYSQYPPGFPLLLVLGLLAGAPWLVNPLLAAASIGVFYLLGKEVYGEAEGRLAAVLGTLSIWFLMTSSTMLSHTASMLFFAVFLLFLFRSFKTPSALNGAAAGLGLGLAFLIRPYNVAAVCLPLVLYWAFLFVKRPRPRLKNLLSFAAVLLLAVAALMVYNQLTNGHPLKMGYVVKYGAGHGIGFGRPGYTGVPHTPGRGLYLIGKNFGAINQYLFGWPLTSLLFLIPFVIPLKQDRAKTAADLLIVSGFLSLSAGLFFYWGTSLLIGARMFFESLPLLLLMTARGIRKTPAVLVRLLPRARPAVLERGLIGVLAAFTVFAFGYTLPRWIRPPRTQAYNEVLNRDFRGVTDRIDNTLSRLPLGDALVIMKFLNSPLLYFPDGLWGSGFLHNDPLLRNRLIYAQDRGSENIALLRCFPRRRAYLYVGTLEKGLLYPLEIAGDRLGFGDPVLTPSGKPGDLELVARPQDLFFGYSAAFRARLDSLFSGRGIIETDVVELSKLAREAERSDDFAGAAFFLESALQIERDPATRERLLPRLAVAYLRTGNRSEAREITRDLEERVPRLYEVLPRKGF